MIDSTQVITPKKCVSLTFDDGPNREYTPRLLDTLKRFKTKATFFVVGKNAKKIPILLKEFHRKGMIWAIIHTVIL